MRKRDPEFIGTTPEIEDEDDGTSPVQGRSSSEGEEGLGYSEYLCRVLYLHNCRNCPRFSCRKRKARSKYQE